MNVPFKSGLHPIRQKGGAPFSGGLAVYPIKNNFAKAFYEGQPVMVSTNGYLDVASNTRTTAQQGTGANRPLGVAMGFAWVNETDRRVTRQNWIPANTSSVGSVEGNTTPVAYVASDPNTVFAIKADLSVPITMNGQIARVTNASTGSTFTGRSNAELATTGTPSVSIGAHDAMFRVVGVVNIQDATSAGGVTNTWDTAQTIVEVVFIDHALN
jgi:hypothetical protein